MCSLVRNIIPLLGDLMFFIHKTKEHIRWHCGKPLFDHRFFVDRLIYSLVCLLICLLFCVISALAVNLQ